jgi:hypothetical protein
VKTELEGSLNRPKGPGPGWLKGNVSRAALYHGYARASLRLRAATYAYETTVRLLHRDTILLLICLKSQSLIYLG